MTIFYLIRDVKNKFFSDRKERAVKMDLKDFEIKRLNAETKDERLDALKELMEKINKGEIEAPKKTNNVNNHIHTFYSFSPYSPTMALFKAYENGLITAGIMDHDSVAGAKEFIEAGKIIGMAVTVGVECRTNAKNTKIFDKRINNPDQKGIAYAAIHGIPHTQLDEFEELLKPVREKRNLRNKKMAAKLNELFKNDGITLDFERDIYPISKACEDGSITERHILFSLAGKIIEKFGKGEELVSFLENKVGIALGEKNREQMLDKANPYYDYDLLGLLKSELVEKFYIDADEECPLIEDFVKFAADTGGISAYAYLGDVGSSVTGDKKTQKFEDDYIDLLFQTIKEVGFNAVTYMPTRNTAVQLELIRKLCFENDLFEISGEDINSPRQSFICEALQKDEFKHLINATWALIGHEKAATRDLKESMFSRKNKEIPLAKRIEKYEKIGKE